MQHEALAHLHLPDALLSFWRADVLTYHASKSSALFYCFTEQPPMRGTACMWHTNCICSPHHHTHRCFPETAAVCHHSAPTHPLYIGFTALLGIAIAIFWSIYLIFCKGNAHCVLLPGDQQFQLISFQTCFHYVTEWKAHLLRAFTGLYFAKLLTCGRPPTLA